MNVGDVFVDSFGRVRDSVHRAIEGLTNDELSYRIDADANSIAWLVWHLTRIEDDHVCDAAGTDQSWTSKGWATRFALPFDESDTGYGHDTIAVAQVACDGELLLGYHDAVHDDVVAFVSALTDADLDRIVDRHWDPPVTLGVRLVSVIADALQHGGQANYVRGVLLRESAG